LQLLRMTASLQPGTIIYGPIHLHSKGLEKPSISVDNTMDRTVTSLSSRRRRPEMSARDSDSGEGAVRLHKLATVSNESVTEHQTDELLQYHTLGIAAEEGKDLTLIHGAQNTIPSRTPKHSKKLSQHVYISTDSPICSRRDNNCRTCGCQ
jgi:hypothetical protein